MANLEVQIGADKSDFDKKIKEIEFDIKELSKEKAIQIKAGLDTSEITKNIKDAKKSLLDLKTTMKDTGNSFSGATPKIASGSNALMQFGRIAQDAPFGIMGIGNNITATAEAFTHLSKESGGAGGALKAVGASLAGPGGVLLAVSLVTTALTIMSQKGISVGDIFNKLTGNFDEFKKSLQDVNAESAKQSGSDIAMAKAYVKVAQDETKSREDRLIAVKKLQDEYPAYFGNLTKEQILNGNVTASIKELTIALIAKAKAQAFADKIGELASKEAPLRAKETELIEKGNAKIKERNDLLKRIDSEKGNERLADQWVRAGRAVESLKNELADTQKEIRGLQSETGRWQSELDKVVSVGIDLDFKPDPKKRAKKVKELHDEIQSVSLQASKQLAQPGAFDIGAALNQQFKSTTFDPMASLNERMEKSRIAFINRLKSMVGETKVVLFEWNTVISDALGNIGTSIGNALANGGNVLQAVGASLLGSLGALLSSIGDKLITVGVTAVIAGTALATMFTPAGIAAGIAAIALGTTLKAGGGFLGGKSQQLSGKSGNNQISAGNSVSTPTSSISTSSSSGLQNVVFEISGTSLIGVIKNSLNKNSKLGGTITI